MSDSLYATRSGATRRSFAGIIAPAEPSPFTPREGWTTAGFLLAMNLVVIVTVETTHWVSSMPRLWAIALLGFILSLAVAKYRGPVLLQALFNVGILALGVLVAFVEAAGGLSGGTAAKISEAVRRVWDWSLALSGDGLSNDRLPFQVILGLSTWLVIYLSTMFTFRLRWAWVAVVPPAVGLMTHQTYLPVSAYPIPLFLFFLFAILFMGESNLVASRMPGNRQAAGVRRLAPLNSLLILTAIVLIASWVVPVWEVTWGPLHRGYLATRGPYASLESGMERAFAGVPAKVATGRNTFGTALPLRGAAGNGQAPVFAAISDYPTYWRAQTYDSYQGQGWVDRSDHRQFQPVAKSPLAKRAAVGYSKQTAVSQQVTLAADSDVLYTGGQPAEMSIDSTVELSAPKTFQINLIPPTKADALPPDLYAIALRAAGQRMTARQVKAILPRGTRDIAESSDSLTVTRDAPVVPDVLSVRSSNPLKAGTTYQVLSLASVATAGDLRSDGTTYPSWVTDSYLQLPSTLPARVKDLSVQLAAKATTPLDKAEAIQDYLRTLHQTQAIDPPPLNQDVVDYFVFTQQGGYDDYFASAMAVMLRAAGVPARLVAGYATGTYDEASNSFLIRQADSHTWPEVYFPTYGWVAFEPVPSFQPVERGALRAVSPNSTGSTAEGSEDVPEEPPVDSSDPLSGTLQPQDTSFLHTLWLSVGRKAAVITASVIGVGAAILLISTLLWQANFIGMSLASGIYARMAFLGGIAWRPQRRAETPAEYAAGMSVALGLRQDNVNAIAAGFNKSRYSPRTLSRDDRIGLERAWRGLRRSMFRRVFQRLDLRDLLRRET